MVSSFQPLACVHDHFQQVVVRVQRSRKCVNVRKVRVCGRDVAVAKAGQRRCLLLVAFLGVVRDLMGFYIAEMLY